MDIECDVLVVGGGIAGLSLASELADRAPKSRAPADRAAADRAPADRAPRGRAQAGRRIVLAEVEDVLAHHASGRSAQQLIPGYGPPPVRELTDLTVAALLDPSPVPATPLAWPGEFVLVGPRDEVTAEATGPMRMLGAGELAARCPELAGSGFEAAALDPTSVRTDAAALLGWHRSRATAAGVRVLTGTRVRAAERKGERWSVVAGERTITATTVVDAAGAWADEVAGTFGAAPLGLVPLRRTAALVTPARPLDGEHPMVCITGDGWYYRPEGERVLVSPSEAVPSAPCDARPHPGDVEQVMAAIEAATDLAFTGIERAWTGLRTEAPDGVPVCGFDAEVPGFLWLAGQGGYGFQTSAALARAAADLLLDGTVGPWCSRGTVAALDPHRFDGAAP